ncbi:long-chain-fatty-acid--CoA ligase [Mycolicibacterium madagascariense]|uniref:Long-chain-fatty-acid--CoA ligase FadD13 n=1 Tax=Mycolicibacterium madagascariense TaxID=212765 RepID=A0A7I7XLB2_9MYCO|nr:long-chain fatty acid--CoA ligase [Mycolicibacterium madagascariense]MCV7012354.1 long-chain fatty acid--CoA ligase [Mycolicibacterium madagascariense]BBZ30029.1 long-chain-fatty-acid--CoA ligase [Mycolicibacterium madagascariense]
MQSTMQDVPLTVATIMRYACEVNGERTVSTATGDGGQRTATYRELGEQAGRLANALRALGVTGDDRVGTFMWNNAEHLAAYLAVPSMGAVLHTLNIRLSAEQIAYIANEAADAVIIADLSLTGQLAPVLPLLQTVRTVLAVGDGDLGPLQSAGVQVLRYDEVLAAQSPVFDWPELVETDAAAMCYTSGTTGNPKGVVYSHRSSYLHAMSTCTANTLGIGAADSVLPIVPMFHANAWGLPYAALMAGADLVLTDRFLDAASIIGVIETCRPTVAGAVPTIWNDVMHRLDAEPGHDISSLRLVSCGGSAVPVSLMQAYEEKFDVQIRQLWGMTETSPVATMAWPPPGASAEEHWALRGTQGRPMCGVEVRIVDDAGDPLPNDGKAVGELEVRGPWITGAYFRDRDPEKFASGWLRTGDVGRVDPLGYVTLTDRAKDVIKSGGEWISSVDLENHLIAHPAVVEAAVVGVPDERWQERPLAAVVLDDDAEVTPAELREFLADKVVRWWLPERWTFVDAVPRTSVGKYDKKTIRARHAEGLYDVVTLSREQT